MRLHGATSQKTKLHTRRREDLKSHKNKVVPMYTTEHRALNMYEGVEGEHALERERERDKSFRCSLDRGLMAPDLAMT
jgi:hypothetical protein